MRGSGRRPSRLVVAACTEKLRPALATGALRRIRLFGARLVARLDESAWDQAARHLVDDDRLASQAVLGDIPAADLREHMIRLAARERLGDGAGPAQAVDLALPALLAPAGRPALALLVRTCPLAVAALLARVGAALLYCVEIGASPGTMTSTEISNYAASVALKAH